jgi:hypothetical protein
MQQTMDPWDWNHETVTNAAGAVIEHKVALRTEQAWVDVVLPDGGIIRVDGKGNAWREAY